ncbi:nucleoside-diphosphate-sugar epimerase [Rhizobium sp. BK529]|uniref:NAD-dependent epimerase/dehydratase family protein n=1 Tax=Rhizobium sp. BK529 TaxID=2586983 RepID=UPI0016161BD0|nr:NAD(P)-dependent oxidoreductase [Rhizobium sp. BK529]MBB3594931.1 nucleoside-diphosphate-sugar epimerase [Rhizobium sp. BK529]
MSEPKSDAKRLRVLVTGAAGLIGKAAAHALRREGHLVLATDRTTSADCQALDFTDRRATDALIDSGIDAIVHCGAISGPADARNNPELIAPVNVGGTMNLLELGRRAGIRRFVYCSSTSVYGDISGDGPVAEDVLLRPKSLYGASKAAGELVVAGYGQQFGFSTIALRISTVYGPDRRHFCAIRTLVDAAVQGRRGLLDHGLHDFRQYVHVGDAAASIVLALEAERPLRSSYTITGGERRDLDSIAGLVSRLVPGFDYEIGESTDPGEDRHPPFSIAAAENDLGYVPRISMEQGIAELIAHVRAYGAITEKA